MVGDRPAIKIREGAFSDSFPSLVVNPSDFFSRLLEQIAGERNVRTRESALENKGLERFQTSSQGESALSEGAGPDSFCRAGFSKEVTSYERP